MNMVACGRRQQTLLQSSRDRARSVSCAIGARWSRADSCYADCAQGTRGARPTSSRRLAGGLVSNVGENRGGDHRKLIHDPQAGAVAAGHKATLCSRVRGGSSLVQEMLARNRWAPRPATSRTLVRRKLGLAMVGTATTCPKADRRSASWSLQLRAAYTACWSKREIVLPISRGVSTNHRRPRPREHPRRGPCASPQIIWRRAQGRFK
jgi:hypothetical protein